MRYRRYRARLARHLPTRESIIAYRFLHPWRHILDHHALWQFNRRSAAGGLAVGLFFSMAVPFGQIPLAAIMAIVLRVNLPLAVFGTLLSNPLTTPALLYAAYRLGAALTGSDSPAPPAMPQSESSADSVTAWIANADIWFRHAIEWVQAAGLPLVIGLGILSTVVAAIGYGSVLVLGRLLAQWRWKTRCAKRRE